MRTELSETLLQMEHITKSFSGVKVLEDVFFDLSAGEVHVLAGENGAGKTTLIKILAGVHTDFAGEIRLKGQPIRFKNPHDAAESGISAIHQDMSLINAMTVVDNIFLGKEHTHANVWMDYRTQKKKAEKLLKQLGIEANLNLLVEDYPVSVRQMIEIAKALAYDARIIIMDEPTSALNELEVKRLFQIIQDLKQKKYGIIYISHRLEEIYEISDRITVLRDGKLIGTAKADDLSPQELIRWMVGREISQQFPDRMQSKGQERLKVESLYIPDPSGTKPWVVEDVNLSLDSGEILGIAGLRGSGKSELFHGLFGTFGKTLEGKVQLDGQPIKIHSPMQSIKQGLVLLTNDRKGTGLVLPMNIIRNISLSSLSEYSSRGWMQVQKEKNTAQNHIEAFGIKAQSMHQEVETLSGGNQQKVVLAKWLETHPKVLLLDEPTLGVDVGAKHDIYSLMNQWTAQGMAILLITSELPELLAMSDRIMVMHRGRVTAEFSKDEATQERITHAAMGDEKSA
ncbi:MAG: sugar ABC transporter ATP-binding protein [Candidatus Aminicenantes bacterium]|nr:MAG: sugar ABC transporter ATP-binding protein [Candidatus Aminicenantes bacterium]